MKIFFKTLVFVFLSSVLWAQGFNDETMEGTLEGQSLFQEGLFSSSVIDYLPDSYSTGGEIPTKRIALYIGRGTWGVGKAQFKKFLKQNQYSYEVITARQILDGKLNLKNFDILIMPGGKSWKYLEELGSQGTKEIKKFVADGGGYFGICAGAYFAVSQRYGPSDKPLDYGIGLLEGVAVDGTALNISPFHGGMMSIDTYYPQFKSRYEVLMLGGPSFEYSESEMQKKNIQVLGSINPIHTPTMIFFNYGKGKVFLSGPHMEVEESKSIVGLRYKDPDSEWPLVDYLLKKLSSFEFL